MTIRTQLAGLILIAGVLLLPARPAAQTSLTVPTAPTAVDKAIDQSVGDHVKVKHLLTALQQAVAKHDAAAVAALVHYPIKVDPGRRPFTIKSPEAFVANYDRIITHDITAAIFKQKYEALFANSRGVMIGDGEVWITGFCRDKACKQSDIKIGTIQDTVNLRP